MTFKVTTHLWLMTLIVDWPLLTIMLTSKLSWARRSSDMRSNNVQPNPVKNEVFYAIQQVDVGIDYQPRRLWLTVAPSACCRLSRSRDLGIYIHCVQEIRDQNVSFVISPIKLKRYWRNMVHRFLNKFAAKWYKRFYLTWTVTIHRETWNAHCARPTYHCHLLPKKTPEFIP